MFYFCTQKDFIFHSGFFDIKNLLSLFNKNLLLLKKLHIQNIRFTGNNVNWRERINIASNFLLWWGLQKRWKKPCRIWLHYVYFALQKFIIEPRKPSTPIVRRSIMNSKKKRLYQEKTRKTREIKKDETEKFRSLLYLHYFKRISIFPLHY